jgi:uncharacterized membrane protein YhaH (DUF805 family)
MWPTRTSRRSATLLIFLASCAISLLTSLFFYAWFGRAAGAVFLQPGRLFTSVLGDSVGAVLLLLLLVPLRSAGAGPFWACGIGAVVVLWPPVSDLVSAALDYVAGGLTAAEAPGPALPHWHVQDWFYSLLHLPDNLLLLTGSALLLTIVATLWPVPPSAGGGESHLYPRSAPGRGAPLTLADILFSFEGRLNRRPYIVATLAIGIPNTILQAVVPTDLGLLLQMVLFWPLLAIGTKRAHDRGHGAAWVVCMLGLPGSAGILLQVVAGAPSMHGTADLSAWNLIIALDLLIALPVIWASVEFFFLRGVAGANRYGPDRLAAGGQDRFVPAGQVTETYAAIPSRITPEAAARFRDRFRKK